MKAYFEKLFCSNGSVDAEILSMVQAKVTAHQNATLLQPFTRVKIHEAVMFMHPDKSPGPDGFNLCFYQTFWEDVGQYVTDVCLECLNNCSLPESLNDTNIVLIPKVRQPSKMTDLRPILLCNVIVKIMTKVLANRLKLMLNSVILESQSAFIPGRLITDNVMIAFEAGHYLK